MKINITVLLKSKIETADKLNALLEGLVEKSRKEEGCIQYDLHQDVENSNVFILHEVWQNKAIFDLHNSQEYVKHFFSNVPELLGEKPQIIFTNKIA
ncbi:putative quinol monooxygenase [Flavobacterium sp.]|uniref:putative quinol monooxygenase n=1 Tax=Flavobacterium sp. TaxID=239 RepID=UPI002604095F|nr:putative quinol monooxygenase [Flavobacterium sp.]